MNDQMNELERKGKRKRKKEGEINLELVVKSF